MIVRSYDNTNSVGGNVARPTIAELEKILDQEEEVEIEILPNGEVRAKGQSSTQETGGRKPLTMREDLGGEYSEKGIVPWTFSVSTPK